MHKCERAGINAWCRSAERALAAGFVSLLAAACAGGSGSPAVRSPSPVPAASPAPAEAPPPTAPSAEEPATVLPEVRGFDGGTQVVGGFTNVQSSIQDSIISDSRNRVWGVLPDVFRTLGVETTTVSAGSFTIGNEGARVARIQGGRLSTYLDCGTGILGPNADTYEVTMQLMVQLAGNANGTTTIRTTLDAFARPRSSAGAPLHCASQRTLERRVLELVRQELSGVSTAFVASSAGTRVPVTGDHLRIECVSTSGRLVGEGRFLGASGERVLLGVESQGTSVGVPAANISSVQIRRRTSRGTLGGVIGAALGAAAGAYKGSGWYDPNNTTFHYGKGVYVAGGAVLGALGGMVVGRVTGSFFRTDSWAAAPEGWAIRYTGASQPAPGGPAAACPSFSTGG